MIVLSSFHTLPILQSRHAGEASVTTSLDLGLTTSTVLLDHNAVTFPDGQQLSWKVMEEIKENETSCFLVSEGHAEKIQFFSEHLDRFYSLRPTERAPTMLISGIPMHRIKGIDPHEDTLRKMRAIAPVIGRVLDTTTGLGYTAIQAARTAEEVVTIELDPTVLELARRNPWSQQLFNNPVIRLVIGDSFDRIPELPDGSFARIFHDPPTFKLAGGLYPLEFYRQLHRVLQRGGRMFHYVGDLDSTSGRVVAKGVVRRLSEAGFSRIERRVDTFGVVAGK